MRTVIQPHKESDNVVAGFLFFFEYALLCGAISWTIQKEDVAGFTILLPAAMLWGFAVHHFIRDRHRERRMAHLRGE